MGQSVLAVDLSADPILVDENHRGEPGAVSAFLVVEEFEGAELVHHVARQADVLRADGRRVGGRGEYIGHPEVFGGDAVQNCDSLSVSTSAGGEFKKMNWKGGTMVDHITAGPLLGELRLREDSYFGLVCRDVLGMVETYASSARFLIGSGEYHTFRGLAHGSFCVPFRATGGAVTGSVSGVCFEGFVRGEYTINEFGYHPRSVLIREKVIEGDFTHLSKCYLVYGVFGSVHATMENGRYFRVYAYFYSKYVGDCQDYDGVNLYNGNPVNIPLEEVYRRACRGEWFQIEYSTGMKFHQTMGFTELVRRGKLHQM
jgi:hypothetical protein